MDINVLQELINTMGFPVVMVGYFIWDKTKITNNLVKAITDNTNVMNLLLSRLHAEELIQTNSEAVKNE